MPALVAKLAIRIEENTAMAPTDRSMPAVRMISVWPERQHGDDRDLREHQARGWPRRGTGWLTIENAMIARTSTASGPRIGLACSDVLDAQAERSRLAGSSKPARRGSAARSCGVRGATGRSPCVRSFVVSV